jgi:ABC-type transport system substrate-binding protein
MLAIAGWTGNTLAALLLALAAPPAGTALAGEAVVRGNPQATVGGMRRNHYAVSPSQLHPLNATDLYANLILDRIYETLAETDVETLEHVPLLAERWAVSPDKLRYTFHLDPRARGQDGRPLTAEDVKFSFDVLFNPRLKTRPKWQAYYSNIASAEVVNRTTVRFTAKRDHFRNFINLASLRIVPRHRFPGDDPNETPLAKQPMGSGPYRFESWNKGSSLLLKKDENYWGARLPQNIGRYNQSLLLTKIIATDKVALEAFKKGALDVIQFTPEQWVLETGGPEFGLGPDSGRPLIKLDVQNQAPRGYRYVGWNLGSPLFKDVRVRRAMSHLFDRDTFIDKFYHGLQVKAVGPFAANSRYASPKVKPIGFSIPAALALLREAGWSDSNGDHVLDKDGRPFRFTILTADPETSVKMLTLTKEAMRKAGVDMNIKVLDWSTLLTLIDEYRYDAVMLGWTRSPWPDPTPLWHSSGAVRGGLNLVRYRNPEVDRLIEAGTTSIPDAERIPIFRRIHELIYADQPYTFLTESNHTLVGYRSLFRSVKPWYAYDVGYDYWWVAQATR